MRQMILVDSQILILFSAFEFRFSFPCAEGTYSPLARSSTCLACSAGFWSSTSSSMCYPLTATCGMYGIDSFCWQWPLFGFENEFVQFN